MVGPRGWCTHAALVGALSLRDNNSVPQLNNVTTCCVVPDVDVSTIRNSPPGCYRKKGLRDHSKRSPPEGNFQFQLVFLLAALLLATLLATLARLRLLLLLLTTLLATLLLVLSAH